MYENKKKQKTLHLLTKKLASAELKPWKILRYPQYLNGAQMKHQSVCTVQP